MKDKKNKKHGIKFWVFFGISSFLFLKKLGFFNKRLGHIEKNFKEFLGKEEKEIKKYEKDREGFYDFCNHSCSILKEYFVPCDCNNHLPRILKTKSLAIFVLLSILVKISVVSYLYFIFPSKSKADDLLIARILELTNQSRIENSVPPLEKNALLSGYALNKANDMVLKNYFSHTTPEGLKPWDFIDRSQYAYKIVGENLAMSFNTAEAVHSALMNSVSHRKNILNKQYNEIGLALIRGEIDGKETNVLVELFSERDLGHESQNLVEATQVEEEIVEKVEEIKHPIGEKIEIAKVEADTKEPETIQEDDYNIQALELPKGAFLESKQDEESEVLGIESDIATQEPEEEVKASSEPIVQSSKEDSTPLNINKDQDVSATMDNSEEIPVELIKVFRHSNDIALLSDPREKAVNVEADEKSLPIASIATEYSDKSNFIFSSEAVHLSQIILAIILCILIASLTIKIIVRYEVQHKPVIVQTLTVIILIAGLLFVNFHYLESGFDVIYLL
ncbi:hypothetical protein C0583_02410 [Candidatus Parcubacteria bacterium]|nr:MAG: hypothetical protein C0583_02410 [Candidatus Parcubacteria bacterium]